MPAVTDTPLASWTPNLTSRGLTRQRIIDIVNTPMTHGRRNELVTIAYQDLADGMAGVIGKRNASWCTFSQWPSSTVRAVLNLPVPVLREGVERAFGHGNRGVFNDIGQAYVAFFNAMELADPARPSSFLEPLAVALKTITPAPGKPVWNIEIANLPENPTSTPLGADESLLFFGLACYGYSVGESDPAAKAELIYAGNIYLAAHEQRWLDESLSAGFRVPIRRLLHPELNFKSQRDFRTAIVRPGPRLDAEEAIIHLITKYVVGFWLNGTWIRVGRELPATGGPSELDAADLPKPDVPFLREVVEQWPQQLSTKCWLSFKQRMGFIARLFRLHQQDIIKHPLSEEKIATVLQRAPSLVMAEPRLPPPDRTLLPDATLAALRNKVDAVAEDAVDPKGLGCDPSQSLKEVAHAFVALDPFPALTVDCTKRWNELFAEGLLDASTVATAQEFYAANAIVINASLLFASLPDSYAAAKGVQVLGMASSLGSDPVRRTGETTNFLMDVLMSKDLDKHTSAGRRAIVGVRGFHAITRWVIEQRGDWDATVLGRPVNQEDLFGTMLTFVVPVFEALERTGVSTTSHERAAYTRMWCAIGYLLGVEKDLVVRPHGDGHRLLSFEEAVLLSAQIRHRQRARSVAGVSLLAALMEDVADNFPRALRHLPVVLMRTVGDRDVASVLMSPQGDSWALGALVDVATALAGFPLAKRGMPPLLKKVSAAWLKMFVTQGFGRPYMSPRDKRPDPRPRSNIPIGCLDEA